jgi:hypothetical protein
MIHKDQAWKLALEALEIQAYNSGDEKYTEAITAINQSLALDKMAENARELGLDYEPVAWTPGPNLFKDWCSQYFGPDADDAYLADAIFNLPPIAQRFASTPPAAAPVQEPWCMKMNGCKTKCEDCPDYVPPAAAPMQDEFPLRGILASELKCWHRLTEDEQINLLAFVKNTRPASPVQPEEPVEWGSLPAGKEKVLRKALAALRGPVADGLARRSAIHSLECEIASTPPAAPVQPAPSDERKAFEYHWYNKYHSGSIKARSDGRYFGRDVQTAWDAWQARAMLAAAPAMAYSLDADPSGIRKRAADAIIGALALGAQDSSPAPEGHWLQQFWDIGRTEASRATPPAAEQPAEPQGWKLVPVEPTEIMQDAGVVVMPTVDCHPYDAGMVYKAMLAAAPTQGEMK